MSNHVTTFAFQVHIKWQAANHREDITDGHQSQMLWLNCWNLFTADLDKGISYTDVWRATLKVSISAMEIMPQEKLLGGKAPPLI